MIFNDQKYRLDKVAKLSSRTSGLRSLFNKLGDYYQWIVVYNKKMNVSNFPGKITPVLHQ